MLTLVNKYIDFERKQILCQSLQMLCSLFLASFGFVCEYDAAILIQILITGYPIYAFLDTFLTRITKNIVIP